MPYTREQVLQMQASARVYQAEWDEAFQPWGFRAPAPIIGQMPDEYDRDMAVLAKKQLRDDSDLKKVQYRSLEAPAFETLKPQLQKECKDAASRVRTASRPDRCAVLKRLYQNGLKTVEWIGQRSFVEDFKKIPRRVLGFLDIGSGRYKNTNGRYL
jgi:hypothetical protein